MNKKIKVIDLLNKIANGEEIPKKIKHWKEEYTLVNKIGFVSCTSKSGYCLDLVQCLNEEVEILEDNTEEIEELAEWVTRRDGEVTQQEGKRLEMCYKINELVKAVNKLMKG